MSDSWNIGKIEKSGLQQGTETAVLVGVIWDDLTEEIVEDYLDEMEFLALTAGAVTKKRFVQKLSNPKSKTFIGSGKLEEIAEYVDENDIDMVIFDDDLSGKQTNTIEKVAKVKVIDRSSLILDIFANRAQTAQAKTQVELAQMQYLLPRLRGLWTHLERQRGGIGMRGPGEKEIETDRRIVRDRIKKLKDQLEKIDQQSKTQRKNRGDLVRVALVGYTNVGKSTIMNLLSKSEVFAENKLFATLDTTVRKVVFERMPFLLSDTVGFIRKLPHHLVESFKSTLDETNESDVLVHVVDISHPSHEDHIETVQQTLKDLGVEDMRQIMVFNKWDLYKKKNFDDYLTEEEQKEIEEEMKSNYRNTFDCPVVFMSAVTKEGYMDFRSVLQKIVESEYEERYPYMTKYW